MVEEQIEDRNVRDQLVLQAMRTVPRHLFIPRELRHRAYDDGPLTIGYEQTVSQPYIVASMTEELNIGPESRVLEIGTGCGYQTAVLAEIAQDVFSIERISELHGGAERILRELEYTNVQLRVGDGSIGWESEAPFDGIIVTAAAEQIPQTLVDQLALSGVMVIPIGKQYSAQDLIRITRTPAGLKQESLYPVRFVPLV